jgi:DNA-binding IclR family transcriptional regulator
MVDNCIMTVSGSATLSKGVRLLQLIVADCGRSNLSVLAAHQGIPLATAQRLAATLESEGLIERLGKGCFVAGPALKELGQQGVQPAQRIAARLRRPLERLAQIHQLHLHFGVLEDGMVTYFVKANGGNAELFTAELKQLEAYCSAVGKVQLAYLPEPKLDAYLAGGPFIALTTNTLTEPAAIKAELIEIRQRGIAYDRFEIREDLFCVAVPVRNSVGQVSGGISASFLGGRPSEPTLNKLKRSLRGLANLAKSAS